MKAFLGLVGVILVLIVHMSDGGALRERREAKSDGKTVQKKQGLPAKKASDEKVYANGKIKISNLKPCISKAFCEVNSIVNNPTYDANKEFFTTLNRLNTFSNDEQNDFNGSSSLEDEEESEESSSYEHPPPPPGPPGRYYPGHFDYRNGKALETEVPLEKSKKKHKKTHKKSSLLTKSVNGTEVLVKESIPRNRTSRRGSEEEKEQREFIAKKTRELNLAEDLAALIKISSDIGMAIRSPRKCREVFKKCEMSYDQIIKIFNHTQTIETPEKEITTTSQAPQVTTTTTEAPVSVETPKAESSENNRNKKSRHDFSDEDIEYITDTELHQPVRTYALFSPSEQHDTRHPEEILVEEAFKKFENTFPVSAAIPKNVDFLEKSSSSRQKSKNIPQRQPASSEEEEGDSDESSSGSRERPGFRIDPQYSYRHRASAEAPEEEEAQSSTEVEESPATEQETDKEEEVEKEQGTSAAVEEPELTGSAGDFEEDTADDADVPAEKPSKKKPTSQEEPESSEEESSNEQESSNEDFDQKPLHTRDEYPSENYGNVRPHYGQDEERPLKASKTKGNKKGKRPPKPQNDESSEEEAPEQEMPPPESEFYGYLQKLNDGKGADGIPGKPPRKGKGKRQGNKASYGGGKPETYSNQGGYVEKPEWNQGGYGSQNTPEPPQSFMSSIMSWFSGGSKQGSQEQQQPQQYGGFSGYGQKPYGGNEASTYDDYQKGRPSNYPPPQGYNSGPYSGEGYQSGPPPPRKRRPGRRPPQARDNEESSEEVADEEEDTPPKRNVQNNKRPSSPKKPAPQRNKPGPPPPIVIVPENEEPFAPNEDYGTVVKGSSKQKNQEKQKTKQKSKPEQEEPESEESTESEEVKQKSKSTKDKKKEQSGGVPSYENYYTSIFGAPEKPAEPSSKNRKPQKANSDERDSSLLLSEFDKISNSFSTSADKVPDWDLEDNPSQKINVGSLASNGKQTKGKYTVRKNRNKKPQQTSYESDTQDVSEEEEEEKK